MSTEAFDMTDTIIPKSDQLNAEDILTGPVTITITGVTRGSVEQPVNMVTAEFGPGRPYKPSKTMRRVIVNAWGRETSVYIGRRIRIYRDPDVMFGPNRVGGIKISHLSHIDKRMEVALTVKRGQRAPFTVDPLPDTPPSKSKQPTAAGIVAAFDALGVTVDQLETRLGATHDTWTAEQITELAALGKAIKAGATTTFEEFEPETAEQQTIPDEQDVQT